MWVSVFRPSVVKVQRRVRLPPHLTDDVSRALSTSSDPEIPINEISSFSAPQDPENKAPRRRHPFGKKGARMEAKVERIERRGSASETKPTASDKADDSNVQDDWDAVPTLADSGEPPRLRFKPRTWPLGAPIPGQTPSLNTAGRFRTIRNTSARIRAARETSASVVLLPLPPFTTLSDLARIALRSGARASEVLGVQLWIRKKVADPFFQQENETDVFDAEESEPLADSGNDGQDFEWSLGGTIHFSHITLAQTFRATPLLLELRDPSPSPSTAISPLQNPSIHVFPPAADAEVWPLSRLVKLAEALQTGPAEDVEAVLANAPVSTSPETEKAAGPSTALGRRLELRKENSIDFEAPAESAEAEQGSKREQEIHEREGALELMWRQLEDPDGLQARHWWKDNIVEPKASLSEELVDEQPPQRDSPPAPEDTAPPVTFPVLVHVPVAHTHHDSPPAPEDTAPPVTFPKLVHVPVAHTHHHRYTPTLVAELVKRNSGRWLGLRLPGSGIPVPRTELSASAAALQSSDAANEGETQTGDPAVQLYSKALRKALARERELEAVLSDARAEAMERAAQNARLAAEAQLRTDFGAFGALEGVWVRDASVRRLPAAPPPENAADLEERGQSVFELSAQVAFADAQDAARARTLLPLQVPAYADTQIRVVTEPWPEALSGVDGHETAPMGEMLSPAREGWARRLEREYRLEEQRRKRERERERKRGAASGRWGKERLHEIRERLNRKQGHQPGGETQDGSSALGSLNQLENNTRATIDLLNTFLLNRENSKVAKAEMKTPKKKTREKAYEHPKEVQGTLASGSSPSLDSEHPDKSDLLEDLDPVAAESPTERELDVRPDPNSNSAPSSDSTIE